MNRSTKAKKHTKKKVKQPIPKIDLSVDLNETLFYYEIAKFPLDDCVDYKDNPESLRYYVSRFKQMNIDGSVVKINNLLDNRDRLRMTVLNDILMRKMGFEYSDCVVPFPEGSKYAKLYDTYVVEKNKHEKDMIGQLVMIAQKKWKWRYGWFPQISHMEKWIADIEKLVSVI